MKQYKNCFAVNICVLFKRLNVLKMEIMENTRGLRSKYNKGPFFLLYSMVINYCEILLFASIYLEVCIIWKEEKTL